MPAVFRATVPWRVVGAFAAIYFIWGSSYLGIRFALESLPPFVIGSVRFILAGLILIAIAQRSGAPAPTPVHWRSTALLGGIMFFLSNGCIVWAQKTVPSGLTSLIFAMVPLLIALLGWLWFGGERPGRRVLAGMAIGFAGMALLIGPADVAGGGQLNPVGAALLLTSAVSWSYASLLSRRLPLPESPLLGAGMNLLCGGLMLLAASILTGDWGRLDLAAVSLKSVLAVGHLTLFASVVAFGSYMYLLTVVSPNRVATYAYINPVVAMFLGWALAGEQLTPRSLLAAVVIIGAVILITTHFNPAASARSSWKRRMRLRGAPVEAPP